MKKNRVVKIMMSAAVMATVTTGTVMAKEPESGAEEGVAENRRPGQDKEEEAVYYAMNARQEGGPGLVEPDQAQKEPEEEEEYGPHCITLKKEEVPETPLLYTDEDLYVLAHAICGEGQCCPDEEQLYIGSVILNRRASSAYPDTIKGVVFQRGQYACTWDGNYYREPTEANWRNARWLLENGSVLPGNVVYQAGFRQGSGLYLQTRYHKYCYR